MPQRTILWTVGSAASLVAILARLTGVFRGWDAGLFHYLGQAAGHSGVPLWLEFICAILFAFGMTFIAFGVPSAKVRAGLLSAALLQPLSAVAVGHLMGISVSPFPWFLALLLPFFAAVNYRRSEKRRQERDLHTLFGNHLSALTLAKLGDLPEKVQPGKALATVLHACLPESSPGELDAVVERFREAGAWVETQSGGSIVAVWNVPWPIASSAQMAVEATLPMRKKWQAGVVTGEVISEISAAGAWQMRGAVFEKAAALCQANAAFGSSILLDVTTADTVATTILLRPVDLFKEPGADFGEEVFEPLAMSHSASPTLVAERDEFWNAVILFRQRRFSEALSAFRKSESDPVALRYRERLEKLHSPS